MDEFVQEARATGGCDEMLRVMPFPECVYLKIPSLHAKIDITPRKWALRLVAAANVMQFPEIVFFKEEPDDLWKCLAKNY